jgi:hypothetical protein
MSNHPQLELFFTNAIWSTSHFIQSFPRVLLTLRISPSDYTLLPITPDLDPSTANPSRHDSAAISKTSVEKWVDFRRGPRTQTLEDGLNWTWGHLLEDATGHNTPG